MVEQPPVIVLQRVPLLLSQYCKPGELDAVGISLFKECETSEVIRGLQAELIAISMGKVSDKVLEHSVGKQRFIKYGSYTQWAKAMLMAVAKENY